MKDPSSSKKGPNPGAPPNSLDFFESTLQAQSIKFQIDNSPFAYIIFNCSYQIIFWSESATRLFGWSAVEVLGKSVNELKWVYEEDLENVTGVMVDMLNGRNLSNIHSNRNYRKDGSVIECDWYNSVMVNDLGELISVQSAVLDVTERNEAVRQLARSEEKLDLFFNQSLDGFFFMLLDEPVEWNESSDKEQILDYVFSHQRITRVNDAMLDQYKMSREEFLGCTPKELFKHDVEYGKKIWKLFFDQGKLHIDTDERKSDGTPMWIEGDYICMYDDLGRITGHFGIQREVTKRKNLEDLLLRSEDRYRKIFEASPGGIILLDSDGMILELNNSFCEILGYEKSELINQHISLISGQPDREVISSHIKRILAGETLRHEVLNKHKDGSWRIVNLHETKIPLADGRTGILSLANDITGQKETEIQMMKLWQSVNQSPVSIVITDTLSRIEYVNPRFLALTGYSEDEIMGKNPRILKTSHTRKAEYKSMYETILAGNEWNGEFLNRKKNGDLFWEKAAISPVKDPNGNITHFVGIKEDITEQKRAEQIRTVLYHISDAVMSTLDIANFIKVIQSELGTLIDTTNFYVGFYDEQTDYITIPYFEDQQDNIASFPAGKSLSAYVIRTGKSLLADRKELDRLDKEGLIKTVGAKSLIWLGVPLTVKGKVTGIFTVQSYTDPNAYTIHDLEIMEFVSEQIGVFLEKKKNEKDLLIALEKAKESDRLKSAFLANMSHEIRTPLNSILGFSELLNEQDVTDEERNKFTTVIINSGKRLMHIIDDILDLSKIEAGIVQITKSIIDPENMLTELYQEFLPVATKKGIRLSVDIHSSVPAVRLENDLMRLKQVCSNLIQNALKYTIQGSITIGYRTTNREIVFHVADTGIGIPKEQQDEVFKRFTQLKEPGRPSESGTGLGLAITKSLIENLGGRIWLESEPGEGSTFYFALPVEPK